MLKLVLFSYFISLCASSKILVVFIVSEKRNSVLGESLVKTLVTAGHEVTYVTPFPKTANVHNLEFVDISTNFDNNLDQYWPDNEVANSTSLQMELIGAKVAEQALQDPNMQELLANTTREYDLVIAEWFYSGLLAPIASIFECPLIWYSSTEASGKSINLVHSEINGLYETPPGLTMTERVYLMWSQLYFTARNYYHFSSSELSAYEKYYKNAFQVRWRLLANYEALTYNSSLLFINSHPLLGHRTALPLNAKLIGGHHIDNANEPLPKNLKKVMDDSKDGVVYVDLESNIIKNSLEEHIIQELIEAFGHIKQTVIWKYDEIMVNLPKNLYTMKRPPQQSILDHPKTVAFINYGDMLSIIDATHNGVPVIGLPVLEEQYSTVNLVAERGCGVRVNVDNELSIKMINAINEIVLNNSYQANTKTAKSIIRHQLTPPQDKFLHWVQVVIGTGGARHLRSRTLQVSTLERYNLDLLLLVLMLAWFFTKVTKVCRMHLTTDDDVEDTDDVEDKKDL